MLAAAGIVLVLAAPGLRGEKLGPLAGAPDWSALDAWQGSITREEFQRLLERVYAPGGAWRSSVRIEEGRAVIATGRAGRGYELRFAPSPSAVRKAPRYWRAAREMGGAPEGRPLEGVRVAVDPGHLGGKWARMEERWFQIGGGAPVMEGEMVLRVAEHLGRRLEALGARVLPVRKAAEPVTHLRPKDLASEARAWLAERGVTRPRETYSGPHDPRRGASVAWNAELLFYRVGEIRERARKVNEELRPDLVVCLHFNAEEWGDPARPELVDVNHLHLLLNGCYEAGELKYDDQRFDMLARLLDRCWPEELGASEAVARAMARVTGLPAYTYRGGSARRAGESPYLWVRNLLANRLYRCPVVYVEPYVMNSREVHARVQAGDYEGLRSVSGRRRESLYREYARGVAEGLAEYYRSARAGAR